MIRPALPLCVAAALTTALLARASLADDAGEAADYLARARSFADCMIRHGRDRYGPVHSPLFANALTREDPPRLTPYPLFAPTPVNKKTGKPFPQKETGLQVFGLFDFNKVLNYPKGLGSEGPHKVTLYGCDPYEDRELYEFLFDLSRLTGEPRYAAEAKKALEWWFRHTQGPAGLYPWGEHLGWDFENECPTYFAGPSKHLYAACYHEIKDTVPFLDILAGLPAEAPGKPTPLERYALGIWNAHFWDKDKAWYCRHGDYRGLDDRTGSLSGFPAHLGAYLRVWTAAWLASPDGDDPPQGPRHGGRAEREVRLLPLHLRAGRGQGHQGEVRLRAVDAAGGARRRVGGQAGQTSARGSRQAAPPGGVALQEALVPDRRIVPA